MTYDQYNRNRESLYAASDLSAKVNGRISQLDNWVDKEDNRSQIEIIIRDTIYRGLRCMVDLNILRCDVYEYVHNRYHVSA